MSIPCPFLIATFSVLNTCTQDLVVARDAKLAPHRCHLLYVFFHSQYKNHLQVIAHSYPCDALSINPKVERAISTLSDELLLLYPRHLIPLLKFFPYHTKVTGK